MYYFRQSSLPMAAKIVGHGDSASYKLHDLSGQTLYVIMFMWWITGGNEPADTNLLPTEPPRRMAEYRRF